jgi:hypothetical protein
MNRLWKIIGASAAFAAVYFVRHYFGTAASLVAVVVLLLAWWLLHLYTARRLDGLYSQFQQLDGQQQAQALGELDPEIREDIEKRIAKEKNC